MSAESNTQSDSNRLPGVVTRSSQQSVTPRWAAGSTEGQDDEEAFARYDPSRTAIENKVALVTLQLDKQGFGRYQLCVWILAGFGYMLKEFNVGADVANLSTAFSTGLTVGAFAFGIAVDVFGRKPAFYASCLISSCFGLVFAAPSNFNALCFLAAMIGFGIGGNIPVDGTIVVETIPTQQRWMVALLSTFQPLGVVLCTLLAYAFIPSRTCGPEVAAGECTKSANFGWRTLMLVMGAITLCVFFARFFIFDFHETPQFLLSVGDDEGAIRVLKAIAKQNRKEDVMTLTVEDFQRVDALALGTDTVASVEGEIIRADRDSDGDDGKLKPGALGSESEQRKVDKTATPVNVAAPIRRLQAAAVTSKTTSALTVRQEKGFIAFALFHVKATFVRSIAGLLTLFGNKRLARVSSILFLVYICDFFAFSIAGFFLPLILQDKGGETNHTIRETYASYIAIYAPGLTATLLAGALYSLNRRAQLLSLIFSSALMAVSLFLYAAVNSWESSIGLNALEYWAQSLFNAMLYAYTPITYPSSIRGTGSGTCSTVGRIASIVAPIAGKKLYGDGGPTNAQNTVYLAGAIALVTPLALALLPWETGKRVQAL
ncbi:unnamed protein product [Tilletia controversa]|uniref:Major facilitator superfamily (MFS) profile domain-containing protein n=1 Tax=Tilletia laevis TaxID=157183 RepID=A0A9N8LCJ3_9BASI|nr:unnamed protein product [Tilletia laevis]CAD6917644.1 unnamed protein product [Tilletia caries]CAD6951711.1 unnamed protein product [Tilletia controversa]